MFKNYKQEGNFTCIDSDRARENRFKPKEGRFRLDVRAKFFTECGEALAQAAREVADALSMAAFKARLDGALGSLT